MLGLWLPDLRDPRVGQRLQRTVLRLEASARGHQRHVTIPAVGRIIGPVPVQGHDATVDHLILGNGAQYRVLIGPLSRGRSESASVLVDRAPEAQDVAEEVVRERDHFL